MRKVIKLYLNEKEILDILKCDYTSHRYNDKNRRNDNSFIDCWVSYFYRYEGQVEISLKEAKAIIYDYLMNNGAIDKSFSKFSADITVSHCWGTEDREGYRCSVWTVKYEITGNIQT
jgi:hypothetical protein